MLPTRSTCESAVRTRPTMNEFGRRSSNRVRVDVINLLIMERNCDPKKKNRHGPCHVPCELLLSKSGFGLTNKGVPDGISI